MWHRWRGSATRHASRKRRISGDGAGNRRFDGWYSEGAKSVLLWNG